MSVVPELQTWFILLNCYFSKSVYNGFSLFDFSWLDGFTVLVSKLKMRASLKNYKCCFAVIDNHFPSNEMFHHRMKLLIQYTVASHWMGYKRLLNCLIHTLQKLFPFAGPTKRLKRKKTQLSLSLSNQIFGSPVMKSLWIWFINSICGLSQPGVVKIHNWNEFL